MVFLRAFGNLSKLLFPHFLVDPPARTREPPITFVTLKCDHNPDSIALVYQRSSQHARKHAKTDHGASGMANVRVSTGGPSVRSAIRAS